MFSSWPSCKFDHPVVYCLLQLIKPSQTFSRLHGNSGVTDICCHGDDVYSCGRNGHYCQFAVANDNQLQLLSSNKVIGWQRRTFWLAVESVNSSAAVKSTMARQLNVLHSFLLSYVTGILYGISSLLPSVNLILFTLLLVHLITVPTFALIICHSISLLL